MAALLVASFLASMLAKMVNSTLESTDLPDWRDRLPVLTFTGVRVTETGIHGFRILDVQRGPRVAGRSDQGSGGLYNVNFFCNHDLAF